MDTPIFYLSHMQYDTLAGGGEVELYEDGYGSLTVVSLDPDNLKQLSEGGTVPFEDVWLRLVFGGPM